MGDAATSNNQQVESMIAPAPPQPPNSPTAGRVKATASVQGGLVNQGGIVANMPAEQGIKPLVDLTEGKDAAESDIQKAIKLSLQVIENDINWK